MKFFKWIIYIPIALLTNYLILLIANFLLQVINMLTTPPSEYEGGLINFIIPYIIPFIANILGISSYFFVGNLMIGMKEGEKLLERKVSNVLLLIVISVISIIFAYYCFQGTEYFKGVVNLTNLLASVIFFYKYYRES